MAFQFSNYDSVEFLKYPSSVDSWRCCNYRYMRYSELIDHIEHHHFLYSHEVINNSADQLQQEKAYKYKCDKCLEKIFCFHSAIKHFISKHVGNQIFCLQCVVLYEEENYHKHIRECNIVDNEIKNGN